MSGRDFMADAQEARLRAPFARPVPVPGPTVTTQLLDDDEAGALLASLLELPFEWERCERGAVLDLVEPVEHGHPLACAVRDLLAGAVEWSNREHWGWGADVIVPSFQLVRYERGDRMVWHCDGAIDPRREWAGLVLALSSPDDYGGGLLNIDGIGPVEQPPGLLAIIPGHVGHLVDPVTDGVRYVVTAFVTPAVEVAT